jgi:hypothetical protein
MDLFALKARTVWCHFLDSVDAHGIMGNSCMHQNLGQTGYIVLISAAVLLFGGSVGVWWTD